MVRLRPIFLLCLAVLLAGCVVPVEGEQPAPPTLTPTPGHTAAVAPSATPQPSATAMPSPTATTSPTASATPTASPTRTPAPPPQLLRSYPIDGDPALQPDRPLVLVFDQAMDASSLTAALTISPTVEGALHFPNAETLEFRPAQPWTEGRYEVRLPGAVSAAGTPLDEDWRLRYGVGGRGVPLPVLMYHRFRELDADASEGQRLYSVAPAAFGQQMDWLVAHGWHSISADALVGYLDGQPLPPRPMMITIDDGYKEVYTVAHPVFERTGLRPVLYVIIAYTQNSGYLSWDQLRELVAAGYSVGAHSYDHTNLRGLEAADLQHQIADPKSELERELGIAISAYSYPYGSYSDAIIAVLREQGYRTACTINPTIYQQPDQPFHISRLNVPYDMTLDEFAALLPD
ncbi:MAG: polysaccharide deacetylase family protein [Chloroflexi bacterium]|nr:polysaccharide deacetylase family protein [Chloroflexota bacterium]